MNKRSRLAVAIMAMVMVFQLVCSIPSSAASADRGDQFNDYYGRAALSRMDNSAALLYAYDQVVKCVENSYERISVYNGRNRLTVDELRVVVDAYRRDYAHHFWLGNTYRYSYNSRTILDYIPSYLMEGRELEEAKVKFEAECKKLLLGLNTSMSDYQKELILHDRITSMVTYTEGDNAHSAYGAIVEKKSVCEGYAEAFQYLLHRIGIQSFLVLGYANEAHEWNMVRIDGEYYHVDLTWDDNENHIYHSYFNLTDDMIKEDHYIYDTEYGLPDCECDDLHYFKVNDDQMINGVSSNTDRIAEMLLAGNKEATVYVTGNPQKFIEWYYDNIRPIAYRMGVIGPFSYGYSSKGHEIVLRLNGYIYGYNPPAAKGDANGDGGITNADVLDIMKFIYDKDTNPLSDPEAADVNKDGKLTNADVLAIYRHIFNPDMYPIG